LFSNEVVLDGKVVGEEDEDEALAWVGLGAIVGRSLGVWWSRGDRPSGP
jgi:hypothetical protein